MAPAGGWPRFLAWLLSLALLLLALWYLSRVSA